MQFDHKRGRVINLTDAAIYVEELGSPDNPTLLLLHGGFGSIADFNAITSPLVENFHIVAMDTRGHGRSTLGCAKLNYQQLADDVNQVIERLDLKKFSLLGFSDGGTTALRYALKQDPRLDKLIIIGAGWELAKSAPEWAIYSGMTRQRWKRYFPETYDNYMLLNPTPEWDRFSDSVIAMWQDLAPDNYPFELVKNIKNPIFFVRGDGDSLLPLETVARLKERLPHMAFFNIPFANHMAYEEQSALFLAGLKSFFDEIGESPQ